MNPHSSLFPTAQAGALIRFKDSASTLPRVLAALRDQTEPPDFILGVDTGSTDGSTELLKAEGATIVRWPHAYHHAQVLNFGLARCPAERVLLLSSHTVLEDPEALAKMNRALDDPATVCVSGKWDADAYYSDAISWEELQAKGLKLGSIYSNSFGLIRHSAWEEVPFDEGVPTLEDYFWAVEQVRRGHVCRRVTFPFSYERSATPRDFEFTRGVYELAARHGLRVAWRGRKSTFLEIIRLTLMPRKTAEEQRMLRRHRDRLTASYAWRWTGQKPAKPAPRERESSHAPALHPA